jgi:ubiquinone/menaquinone biosynthesis C-methylase UbiE
MTPMKLDSLVIQQRYDRIAPYFEILEAVIEGLILSRWRKKLWQKVDSKSHHILEIGVGTGKNFAYYPVNSRMTAIDFSPNMLQQAINKKHRNCVPVELNIMDVQSLCFADNSFDTVIASFVFCSVPLPLKGLKELYRVCKPGGQVLLLEHVISSKPFMAWLMNRINPLVVWIIGANINRNTVKNIKACAFEWVHVDECSSDMIKLIEARK